MPTPVAPILAEPVDLNALLTHTGRVAIFVPDSGQLDRLGRRVNSKTKGAVERFAGGEGFAKMKAGEARLLLAPAGLAAEALIVVKLDRKAEVADARKAGAAIAKLAGKGEVLVGLGAHTKGREIALGLLLRSYAYTQMKSDPAEPGAGYRLMAARDQALEAQLGDLRALAEGVFFARDLTWAPSNVLTTTRFAEDLQDLAALGISVEVLEEPDLEALGMRLLLGVGQGSESPSKVVVMRWEGAKGDPLALIGKGVVFDTGGISLKPGAGMEEMTMDMGGAGVVSGVMKALALRKAKAHVVGLVGLVENMPDGRAQRPGDVVASMKGDTVEIINTDAEGRLVLADVMWYAQDRFKPAAMVDLATLTGAIIVALGHEHAGVFANDDALATSFIAAATAEGEGAWRMPLGPGYAKLLKSDVADLKNIGGRKGGAVTAAEFLQRFVPKDLPWMHLDIAGVARTPGETALAPKGVTGWGVLALDRLVRDRFEGAE